MKIVVMIAAAGIVLTAIKWAFLPFLPWRALPRHRIRHMRMRLYLRLHPGAGHASAAELHLRWGRLAMLRRSRRTRPSLGIADRLFGSASNFSLLIGRAHYRHAVRLPLDEHAIVTSPPREGKTGWLSAVILRYPGPVVSTTTKHDVFALTSGVRAGRGPVHVFNPQGIGDVPSTFRWNPVDGCTDPATAIRRADAFAYSVSQHGVEEATFWASKASDYLRAYFHAAALAGLDLRTVAEWVTGMNSTDAETILASSGGDTGWHWASQLAELRGQANRTAQTVRMTMSRALAFLADPELAAAVTPAPDEWFDIEDFLRSAGDALPDRRNPRRGLPGRAAVRLPGQRNPPHRRPGRKPHAGRTARPDPPARAGRGHPDLPDRRSVAARRLGRERDTDHHRGARRGPAPRPVGRRRRPRHPRHLRREDLAARHQRPRHPGSRVPALRHRRDARARRRPGQPPPGHDTRDDPPAPAHPRARRPRRLLPRHRQAPHGLARPAIPARTAEPPGHR